MRVSIRCAAALFLLAGGPAGAAPLQASVLPGSRSVELGNPVTIFATIVNTLAADAANCSIALPGTAPSGLALSYQTTDPNTNALTGTPNTPVPIPAYQGQSFLLTFQGSTSLDLQALAPVYSCDSLAPAATVPGVDTIDLTLSAKPVADIVALAATPMDNGILVVPTNGAAAFAVASINLGIAAPLTVTADTGQTALPLTLTLCQTVSATAQCMGTPTASVSLSFAQGASPTFSVFAQAAGPIDFDPANARIFVRFTDTGGAQHGSTSVAVETQ